MDIFMIIFMIPFPVMYFFVRHTLYFKGEGSNTAPIKIKQINQSIRNPVEFLIQDRSSTVSILDIRCNLYNKDITKVPGVTITIYIYLKQYANTIVKTCLRL